MRLQRAHLLSPLADQARATRARAGGRPGDRVHRQALRRFDVRGRCPKTFCTALAQRYPQHPRGMQPLRETSNRTDLRQHRAWPCPRSTSTTPWRFSSRVKRWLGPERTRFRGRAQCQRPPSPDGRRVMNLLPTEDTLNEARPAPRPSAACTTPSRFRRDFREAGAACGNVWRLLDEECCQCPYRGALDRLENESKPRWSSANGIRTARSGDLRHRELVPFFGRTDSRPGRSAPGRSKANHQTQTRWTTGRDFTAQKSDTPHPSSATVAANRYSRST